MKIKKSTMYTYLTQIAKATPYYMWGMDMQLITPERVEKLIQKYGISHYDGWENKIGYFGCDCSGLLTPITGMDKTAQGYYNLCSENKITGNYTNCKFDFALVFNGTPSNITHVGILIDDKTYEMYNRLDIKNRAGGRWKFYGIPEFFENDATEIPDYEVNGKTCVVNRNIFGYRTAKNAADAEYPACTVKPRNYFVYKTDAATGAVNVTTKNGEPGSWIY